MTEVLLLAAVLGAATAFGLWRRRTDGRLHEVAHPESAHPVADPGGHVPSSRSAPGPAAGPATASSAAAPGAPAVDLTPASDRGPASGPEAAHGSVDPIELPAQDVAEPLVVDGAVLGPADHSVVPAVNVLNAADLSAPFGERATLVQFSSAFCQPCRVTRQVLAEVARAVPGVAHVEIDAESHLDLVRRVDVTRTPTVLILDSAGRIRRRATGAPRRADVLAALTDVV